MFKFIVKKLKTTPVELVQDLKQQKSYKLEYQLNNIKISDLIGHEIKIKATGHKECIHCQRKINKTFNQGYCFPCSQTLARCDLCIVKPERCHYQKGTCREPKWGEEHCLIPHVLYIANSSGLKIGITREYQKLTRWADQGAVSALSIFRLKDRLTAGMLEVHLSKEFNDKTNWRHLLNGTVVDVDLNAVYQEIVAALPMNYYSYLIPENEIELVKFEYPINTYLSKAVSHNLDKNPEISGILHGIRGQYLLIGEVGLNVRNYQGYEITFSQG